MKNFGKMVEEKSASKIKTLPANFPGKERKIAAVWTGDELQIMMDISYG